MTLLLYFPANFLRAYLAQRKKGNGRTLWNLFIDSEVPLKELIKLSSVFFIIYFAANYLNNAAFVYVSPGTVSILSATSGFFTLFLGFFVGVEKMSLLRIIATVVCVGGVVVLGYSELAVDGSKDIWNMI